MTASVELRRAEDLGVVERHLDRADLPTADLRASPATFYLARADGTTVGVAGLAVHGRAGLLRSVAVAPEHRGEGVGTALCRAVEARARGAGVAELYLLTTTAAGFFAGLGYERVERSAAPPAVRASAEFDRLCPASAVCMRKRLAGGE